MTDLSSMSDADLQAIAGGGGSAAAPTPPGSSDLAGMPDDQLQKIASQPASPTFGGAVTYGLANALPFSHDLGAAAQATESYLPKSLQVDDLGDVDDKSSFSQRMSQQRARIDATDAANQKAYPVTSFVTPLVASVGALPIAGPVDAVSSAITSGAPRLGGLIADSAASGLVGAGYGAAYGAGNGDTLSDRIGNAGTGAMLGGAGGALAPAIAKGITSTVGAGASLVKGIANPTGAGADLAADTIARDQAGGKGTLLSPSDVVAAQAAGQPAVAGDLGGQATQRLARTAANASPEAKATLLDPLMARFQNQNTRLPDFVENMYGGNLDADTMRAALAKQAQSINSPAYRKAYADGANGVWNPGATVTDASGNTVPNLADLVKAPDMQSAISDAARKGANNSVLNGQTIIKSPFVADGTGNIQLATDAQGNPAVPTLQFWDQVKRGLDDKINTAVRSGNKEDARDFTQLKSALVTNLDQQVPSYASARQGAFQMFGADNALDSGLNILKTSATPTQIQKAASSMTPLQQQALSYGAASAIVNKAVNTGDNRNVVTLFNTPAIRDKLESAMGPQRASQLEAYFRTETAMNVLKNAVSGNSTTTQQAHDLIGMASHALTSPVSGAIAGAGLAYHEHGFDPEEMVKYGAVGMMTGMMKKAYAGVNAKVMESVADSLASSNPNVINSAINRVAKNKQMMQSLRRVSNHLAALPATKAQQMTSAPSQQQMQYAPAN